MRPAVKYGIWIAIAAVLVVGALMLFSRGEDGVEVRVAEVTTGEIRKTVLNTRAGTVDACRRAQMSPASAGQIASLPVAEGDSVTEGQVLLEIWNEDLRSEIELSQRNLIAERSRAAESCTRADLAAREAVRLAKLRDDNLVSEEELERAQAEAEARAASCKASNDSASAAEARVEVNRARLERTILRSPFDGVIAEINGELGEFVTPSPMGVATLPTVDVIDNNCLYITAPIDEVDAPLVQAGQEARILLDAFPDQFFPGFVRRVAPYVLDLEKQARTVEIEAEIDNPQRYGLMPGYSADVEVIVDVRDEALRVPTEAVIEDERIMVLNTETGRLEERRVEIGLGNWEFTEITEGARNGELVVLSLDRAGVEPGAPAVRAAE
ncbi:MAG: efflux RND transporter periplasmic adaptor subunit [Gammaproteobacteria bacterium]|nr:efflux RND transporter periplasmic adaptor subunit [Gammaproteobacteria bacterium]MYF67893.1 efflux RND transporter periplasmic adaptor subunit [Gammaproteobacteria bacterium]MYK37824.1 efflux RND transporter periplasmic adaptor subunit [Gammaproteobacteria bacterium]